MMRVLLIRDDTMLVQGQEFPILYSYFEAGAMQNSEITQKISNYVDGDMTSDEMSGTCWFKAARALVVPVKTIGPHLQQSLLPLPGDPTPVSIAIKLAHRHCHHPRCTGRTLCLLAKEGPNLHIHKLLWYRCCLILTRIFRILKI